MTEAITRAQPSRPVQAEFRPVQAVQPTSSPTIQPFQRTSLSLSLWARNGQTIQTGQQGRDCAPVRIVFNNKGERRQAQDAGIPHKIIPLTFHFYGNCLSFLYSFTFSSFFYIFSAAAGIFLLFFMLLICVACWPVDCPDELDSCESSWHGHGQHARPAAWLDGWMAGCGFWPVGCPSFVCLLMQNLTIGQNIIFAAPSHIWRWITRGRALNAHWWTFFDLQMSAGANVMNPWWHCKGEHKQINTQKKDTKPKTKSETRNKKKKKNTLEMVALCSQKQWVSSDQVPGPGRGISYPQMYTHTLGTVYSAHCQMYAKLSPALAKDQGPGTSNNLNKYAHKCKLNECKMAFTRVEDGSLPARYGLWDGDWDGDWDRDCGWGLWRGT